MSTITKEEHNRLTEIKDEIKELLDEAENIIRDTGAYPRAEAYWLPHAHGTLDDDHRWMGGSMTTMQNTIDELKAYIEPDEEEEDED